MYKGLDGYWYAQFNAAAGSGWYRLNGSNPPALQQTAPALDNSRYPLKNFLNWGTPTSFPYELDLSAATPDTGTGGQAVVRWRLQNTTAWQQATAQLEQVSPTAVEALCTDA